MLIPSYSCILAISMRVLRELFLQRQLLVNMKLKNLATPKPAQPHASDVKHIGNERKHRVSLKYKKWVLTWSTFGARHLWMEREWGGWQPLLQEDDAGEAPLALLSCVSAQGPALIWSKRGLCKAHPTQAVKSCPWILIISTAISCRARRNYDLKLGRGKEQADTLLWIPNPALRKTGRLPI